MVSIPEFAEDVPLHEHSVAHGISGVGERGLDFSIISSHEDIEDTLTVADNAGLDVGEQCGDYENHVTFLYDETGNRIETDECLTALLEDAHDDLWLLPALALHHTESDRDTDDSEYQRHHGPKRTNLTCRV